VQPLVGDAQISDVCTTTLPESEFHSMIKQGKTMKGLELQFCNF